MRTFEYVMVTVPAHFDPTVGNVGVTRWEWFSRCFTAARCRQHGTIRS